MPLSFSEVVPVRLFHDGAFRWRLATRSLDEARWLQFDDSVDAHLTEKARVLRDHRDDAFAALDGSEAPAAELADLVEGELERVGRELPSGRGDQHPIEWAARGVQEDLTLLERDEGGWRLVAAAVCFPTRWSPARKVGLPLDAVHGPVPGYDSIARQVDRFFDRLKPGSLAWRPNWSLVGDDRLRLPVDDRQAPTTLGADPIGSLWFRIERQTVRRLVTHPNAVVFAVRVHRWPLRDVLAQLGGGFEAELRAMPDSVAAYKNIAEWRHDLAVAVTEHAARAEAKG